MGRKQSPELFSCHNMGGSQLWILSRINEIKNDDMCVDGPSFDGEVSLFKCHGQGGNQKWMHDEKVSVCKYLFLVVEFNFVIFHKAKVFKHSSGQCLSRPLAYGPKLMLKPCDGSSGQQWEVETVLDIAQRMLDEEEAAAGNDSSA